MTRFFILGRTPVRYHRTLEGGLRVEAYDPLQGQFRERPEFRLEIDYERDGVAREVTEREFGEALEDLKANPPSWVK